MLDISFSEISAAIKSYDFPPVDLVIGIAEGGTVPAALAASRIGCELKMIRINYRDDENNPRYEKPVVLDGSGIPPTGMKILLVDDVSVTGKTLDCARALLQGNTVYTFALKGRADFVLFTDIKECVSWPWKLKK